MLAYKMPITAFTDFVYLMKFALPKIYIIVELLICYICCTLGTVDDFSKTFAELFSFKSSTTVAQDKGAKEQSPGG